MSEKAKKRSLKIFLKMSNLHMKSEQIAVQLFYSYFDLHGESTGTKYQNDYYIMEALCAYYWIFNQPYSHDIVLLPSIHTIHAEFS